MTALLLAAVVGLGSSPGDVIATFVKAFNARDSHTMVRLIVGGTSGSIPPELGDSKLRVTVRRTTIASDHATVLVKAGTSDQDGQFEYAEETVRLDRTGREWKIVPANPLADSREPVIKPKFVAFLAFVTIHSPSKGHGRL